MRYSNDYTAGVLAVIHRQWLHRRPEALRVWRVALGLSQKRMVDEISEYSPKPITLKTYRRWEQGKTQPHLRYYRALQQVLQKHRLPDFNERQQLLLTQEGIEGRVVKHLEEQGELTEEQLVEIAWAEWEPVLRKIDQVFCCRIAELDL